jgi:tellurite resistance protein TehA-like permease
LGTLTGLASTILIPYLMFTRHNLELKDTLATWLMPIVPPMVSAATGAALIAHLPAGQDRLAMLLACYAMFGISLLASLIIITLLWGRLAYHGPGPARTIPTLWIVLGPLGQSITAVGLLANAAPHVAPQPYSTAMQATAVLYGIPVWGFAIIWLLLAATITLRTAQRELPYSLTWWSFTFPVGTLVTGTSELALHTHANFLAWASVTLYALLIGAWLTAATRTAHGSLHGRLFLPSPSPDLSRPGSPLRAATSRHRFRDPQCAGAKTLESMLHPGDLRDGVGAQLDWTQPRVAAISTSATACGASSGGLWPTPGTRVTITFSRPS